MCSPARSGGWSHRTSPKHHDHDVIAGIVAMTFHPRGDILIRSTELTEVPPNFCTISHVA